MQDVIDPKVEAFIKYFSHKLAYKVEGQRIDFYGACSDCQRKFSIPHVQSGLTTRPSELIWLLNEIGMLTSKLTDLLAEVNDKMEFADGVIGHLRSDGVDSNENDKP
jgi:hypothetical protein